MNPITYSLDRLHYAIPREILEKTFISNINHRTLIPVSLDARIRELVIEPRVLVDCNLVAGTEMYFPLIQVPREIVDMFNYVYRIPKFMTQGRRITQALSVSFGEGAVLAGSNLAPSNGNALLDATSGVLNSALPIPLVSTAQCQLIGENTVLINDNMALPNNIYLRCWVENDESFNHIQPASYPAFSKLVELAVKAYIYINSLVIMDKAYIFAGAELGRYKEIVDSYADANEMYETHRDEKWRKTAFMNDYQAHTRQLRRTLGGAH